jgi:Bacterial Ig domain
VILSACGRMQAGAVVAALLATGATGSTVLGQDSQADLCVVSIGRGATGVGGVTGTMTVRNAGRSCRIVNFSVPEQRVATTRLEIARPPAQGRLAVINPNVVAYTPNPGYTGPDEFEYEGSGPGREGRPVPFSVRIQVRVVGPDGPLR